MAKVKFTVVSGKHTKEDGTFVRQGETLEMEEAEAAKFPNKFTPVLVAAPAVEEDKDEGKKEGDDKKPAAPAAPAAPAK